MRRCLFYIDLNMLRAKVVDHPKKWKHCGYHEIINSRKRYRIINQKRLQQCLRMTEDPEIFIKWYKATLEEKIQSIYRVRESYWTEAYAIGDEDWLKEIYRALGFKNKKILPVTFPSTKISEMQDSQSSYFIEG